MKKTVVLLAVSACMFIATAEAQDTQAFKQAGGENNLQLMFTPFSGNPIGLSQTSPSQNQGGIMYRKFNSTGKSAWRIGFSVGMSNSTETTIQAGDTTLYPTQIDGSSTGSFTAPLYGTVLNTGLNPEAEMKTKTFSFSIRPGYEMHFAGTDRLSPYWGAELVFGKASTSVDYDIIDAGNYSFKYDTTFGGIPANEPDTLTVPWTVYTLERRGDFSSTTFGLNLIAGFDFYFAKNLSLGAEMGFGWATQSWADIKDQHLVVTHSPDPSDFDATLSTEPSVSVSHTITDDNDSKARKQSGIGFNVVGQIKLGWLF